VECEKKKKKKKNTKKKKKKLASAACTAELADTLKREAGTQVDVVKWHVGVWA
jgi:hypothetical protein